MKAPLMRTRTQPWRRAVLSGKLQYKLHGMQDPGRVLLHWNVLQGAGLQLLSRTRWQTLCLDRLAGALAVTVHAWTKDRA